VVGSGSEALLVALGAIPGAWLRLRLVNHFQPMLPRKHWGTFVVNVTACFSLGLVLAQVERCGPITGLALLIGVGFLGSLSTFSTFVMEVFNELRAGEALLALVLMFASLLMGLVAAAAGYGLGSYG
tara:strand:- start:1379 stop:1759 length:381 start_codon:yes stop_codon:yes gene_type:complete